MPHYNLALIGFGNVGQALARLLLQKRSEIQDKMDISFEVTAIATGSHGRALDTQGLDINRALALMEAGESLDHLSSQPVPENIHDLILSSGAHVLFENTPVNYQSGQPAVETIRTALENGMHACTANKGPVVHGYKQLTEIAHRNGVKFYFESSVMDGAPIFSMFRSALPAATLNAFYGILNATTNLILSRMEDGETFEQALAYAQSVGIVETDPSGDVDGWDAAIKTAALVTVLMGIPYKPDQVDRKGIRGISPEDISNAKAEGKRWKLVCSARREGDSVHAQVSPQMVGPDSPLYNIEGTSSIVQFETDVLGKLSLIEADPDPGPHTTAYGLLADFLNAVAR
jgi:homoserine dehydrogenase